MYTYTIIKYPVQDHGGGVFQMLINIIYSRIEKERGIIRSLCRGNVYSIDLCPIYLEDGNNLNYRQIWSRLELSRVMAGMIWTGN